MLVPAFKFDGFAGLTSFGAAGPSTVLPAKTFARNVLRSIALLSFAGEIHLSMRV